MTFEERLYERPTAFQYFQAVFLLEILNDLELAHVAEQILAHGKDAGLRKIGDVTVLGRAAAEYRGTASVTEDGTPYHNEVYRVIAAPYLLVEKLHDSQVPGLSYQRELISLDEGSVGDADLAPPAGTRPP